MVACRTLVFSLALLAPLCAASLEEMESALRREPNNLRLGAEYRQAAIDAEAYDRSIEFFESLTAERPRAANAHLNLGFAFVDKVPTVGSITQVILAQRALEAISEAVELNPTWISLYSRGAAYLFWPKVFGRAPDAVADLERALEIVQRESEKRDYHVRTYIGLGDAYWKADQPDKARATWRQGLELFPASAQLERRLGLDGEELTEYLGDQLDPSKRVDTSLHELWEGE